MHVLTRLEPYLLSLLLLGLVLLAAAIPLYVHRRRTRHQPASLAAAPGRTTAAWRLRQSFRRARGLIKSHLPGRNALYRIPWFLLLGESASGKTSLLHSAGLPTPLGMPDVESLGRQAGCTWWFFDHGVVLDTDGTYIQAPDGTSDARGWQMLLRLLQRYRPARPLDGIILTIPCSELVGAPEQRSLRQAQAMHKASALAEKLWQAQRLLGLRLPVYILLTKCDQLSGFQSFCAALPSRLLDDIFGWSNPYTLEAAYTPQWLGEAFTTLKTQLAQVQMEVMAQENPLQDGDEFFLFPQALEEIQEPIQAYMDHLFAASAYHEAFFFRGLYFCGDTQRQAAASWALPAVAEAAAAGLPGEPVQPHAGVAHPSFLKQLFATKIFPEHRLAHPVAKTLLTRSRAVLAAQALLLGVLLVGGLGMWRAYQHIITAQQTLQPVLRDIALDVTRRRETTGRGDTQFRQESLHLLQGMAHANAAGLQSLFFPESWFDPLHRDIVQALTVAYSTVILQAMGQEFHHKAEQLLQGQPLRPEAEVRQSTTLLLEHTPEFVSLRRFTSAWAEFERYAHLYNTHIALAGANDLQVLSQVVRYLFGQELPADFTHNARYYEEALGQASGAPVQPAAYSREARARAHNLSKRLYERLFASNPPLTAVRHLSHTLERLARQRPGELTLQPLRETVEAITQTQHVLSKPEFAWLMQPVPTFGDAFERLSADMTTLVVFGADTTQALQQSGLAAWQQGSLDLRAQRSSLVGPLLHWDEAQQRMTLTPEVLALHERLQGFLQLDFIRHEAQRSMRTSLTPRTHLIWDGRTLEEALRLHEPYNRFRSEYLKHFPVDLRRQIEGLALRHLRANLSDLLAQAQILAPTPDGFGQASLEAGIGPEIQNLQGMAPLLGRLVDVCHDVGLGELAWTLLSLVNAQALSLLETVDSLLEREQPYAFKDSSFAWWTGTTPPALGAFEVRDNKELFAYLGLQRDRLRHLARAYAEPLVAFVTQRPRQRTPRQAALVARWQGILAELEHYDNKKPGNAVSALETWIGQDMEQLTTHNCLQVLATRSPDGRAGDLFSQRRASLHQELAKRCQVLTQELLNADYGRLASFFNQRLAGKFPFTDASTEDDSLEADPQAIRDFYRLFEPSAPGLRELLRSARTAGLQEQQVLTFLEQMEAVRTFFLSFLNGEPQQQGPVFDLSVDFRVNKNRERGGNQIIDWQLLVGEQAVRARDPEHQSRWRFGEPLQVMLRWAKDAPLEPSSDGSLPQAEVRDGTVLFTYPQRWALLRLLRQQASAPTDFERFADPRPHTLKFQVQTRAKQDKTTTLPPAPGTDVKVFIGVTVLAPDKKERLVLPPMPVQAPELSSVPALAAAR
ncbi:MAG: type VI secretion protein IcmF/TssM N-terminal domain-containing protein [Candidatus Tectimicrobiota bacterium]